MTRLRLLAMAIAIAVPAVASAEKAADENPPGGIVIRGGRGGQPGAFGLGLSFGYDSGIDVRYFMDRKLALDVRLDFVRLNWGGLGFVGGLLWHPQNIVSDPAFDMPFYVGLEAEMVAWRGADRWVWSGGRYWAWSSGSTDFGVRVPFGLALWLRRLPFGFFVEAGPEVFFVDPGVFVFGTIGAHYFF